MPPKRENPNSVFTPGSPLSELELFKGRADQIRRIMDAITGPGRHPVLFGQRGVGKTSLVNLLEFFIDDLASIRVTCDSADTFKSIWNRVLSRASVEFKERAFGFNAKESTQHVSLADFLGADGAVSPSDVARVMEQVGKSTVFVLDEFDRVTDPTTKTYTADLIKQISDNCPLVTLILVGVGRSVADLIGEHPSISRNLVQIEMPKMNAAEIKEILETGFNRLLLEVETGVLDEAARLTDGFPHYAHLLGLSAARACAAHRTNELTVTLFESLACDIAVEESIETYRAAFARATRSNQTSRYPHILCACALAQHDDEGVFRATDVVDAMKDCFDMETTAKKVAPALRELCGDLRGPILAQVPVGTRKQYRFIEPMMRPFLRIRAKSVAAEAGA